MQEPFLCSYDQHSFIAKHANATGKRLIVQQIDEVLCAEMENETKLALIAGIVERQKALAQELFDNV
jgi:hypothetical protein